MISKVGTALAMVVFCTGSGMYVGKHLCEGKAAAELARVNTEFNKREALRLIRAAETRAIAQSLEDQANADPIVSDCGLTVDRVRRLNLR